MNKIFLIDKKTLVKTETSDAKIVLDKATIVQTKLNASDVKEFIQEGNTLVIKLKNGEEIRIENYFSKEINGEQQSGLVLEDTECGFLSLVSEKGLLSLKEITGLEELLTSTTGVNLIPWLVGGAVTGGIIGAIDGGSSNGTSPKPLDAPTVEILTDENDDGLLSHKELGSKTAVDVAVSIPTGAKVGDTVTVTDQSGKKYSHVLSADDLSSGKVIVKVDVPAEGTELKVTATITNNGGESVPSNEDSAVVDTIPPSLTIEVPKLGNDNTPTISGTSDAPEGSEVVITITDKDGNTQTVTTKVDGEGNYKVDVPEALPEGEFTVTGVVTDPAGNPSEPASDQGTVDTVPPTLTITVPELGNDNTPTISGTSDAPEGSEVVITITDKDGNTQTVTTKVDGEGNYKVDVPEALPEGDFTVTGVVTDPAGNPSEPASDTGTIDTVPPTLTITVPELGNDNTPTISGTSDAPEGSEVVITITDKDGNTQTVTTKVDGEGNYKVDVPEALPEGDFTVTGVVTDPAGNPSEPASDTGTIDTVPPTLTITVPELGNDNTPTISGTSDAPEGSEVVITITDKDGNTQTVTTKVDGEGNYKVDVPEALPEGDFTVTGVVTDPAGNPSEPALDTGTIDTVPPSLTITVPELGNDNTPTISGTSDAPEGSEVVITITDKDGNTQTVTTKVDGEGNYKVDVPEALPEGEFTVTGVVTDPAGNPSEPVSDTGTIDTVPPTLTITVPELGNDNTPTISGTSDAPEGSEVVITITDKDGNTQTVTTKVDGEGNYKVDVPEALPEGEFTVTGVVTDPAGNPSEPVSDTGTVDTIPPTVEVIINPDNTVTFKFSEPVTGFDATDIIVAGGKLVAGSLIDNGDGTWTATLTGTMQGTTVEVSVKDESYTDLANNLGDTDTDKEITIRIDNVKLGETGSIITGTTEPGHEVILRDNHGTEIGTATADADGHWTVTLDEPLKDSGSVIASTENQDGVVVTDEAPLPYVSIDIVAGDDIINKEELADLQDSDGNITITGSVSNPNADMTVTFNGKTYPATVEADGTWSIKVPASEVRTDGTNTITASGTVTVEGQDPIHSNNAERPVGADDVPPTLTITVPEIGNDNTPTITGTTNEPAGSIVEITITDKDGNTQTVSTIVKDDQTYTVDVPEALPDGEFTVTGVITDPAGNSTTSTDQGTIDTVPPTLTITVPELGNDNTPTISGTSDAPEGSEVVITITDKDGNTQTVTTKVDGEGNYKVDVPEALPEGDFTVTGVVTDPAGNPSEPALDTGTVDTVPPTLTITVPELGNDNTPTISGTSDAPEGSEVVITITDKDGNTQTVTTKVDGEGNYKVDVPEALPDGEFTVTGVVTDPAGNPSEPASDQGTVDTAPPTLTITVPELGNDNTPTISGTSDAPEGSEVIITITDKDGNTQTVTTKVDGEGNYKVDVPEALPEGEFTVTGVVTDPAGNPSEPVSDTGTIDTVPPTLTITVPELGNDNTPTISGTSDAPEGSEVVITITDKDGNTQTVTTKVDGEGNYKVDVPEALPEGDFTVTGVVTDPAGNPSEPASDTGTVDTVPPSLTITVPELGNDNTPTISGTSDAPEGSEVVITITDKDGNTQTVTTKVDGEGNYKVDVPEALPDGEFTVTGVVTDPAGNPSEPASDTGTIDTVPPSLTITVPELGNDNTPTISGTSDAPEGSEVVITITDKDGNTQTVTTKVDGEGHYKVDVPEALPEGEFTVTGVVTDPAGNPSEPASDQGTIDTVPPSLTITVPELGNDNTPTISGTSDAPEGSEVVITITDKDGNTQTVTTKVDGEGNYKVDVPEALPEGDFTVTGVVTDPAGNPSEPVSDTGTVDTIPPTVEVIINPDNTVTFKFSEPVTGFDATDIIVAGGKLVAGSLIDNGDGTWTATLTGTMQGTTVEVSVKDESYTDLANNLGDTDTDKEITIRIDNVKLGETGSVITGTTEPGHEVILRDNHGTEIGTATADADGHWTVTLDEPLKDSGSVIASTENQDGVVVTDEAPLPYVSIDIVAGDDIINKEELADLQDSDGNITITGSVSNPNADMTVTFNGKTYPATVEADGTWSIKVPASEVRTDGTNTITASGTVTVEGQDPIHSNNAERPVGADDVPPTLTITVPEIGNDNTPTITGTTNEPAGSIVEITITDKDGNTQTVSTIVKDDQTYTVDVPEALPDGEFTVTGVITDPAGNSTTSTDQGTIDTVPPTLTITVPELGNDNTPTISGTSDAPEGSEVVITITDKDGNTQTVTTKVDGEGNYKVDVPEALPEGDFTVTGVVTDPAGNPSEPALDTGTVDTVPPTLTITVPELGNDNTPTISGTSDAPEGSEVVITITDKDGNTQTVTTKVDGEGNYKVDVPEALPDGEFTVTGVVTDPAGNPSEPASDQGTVDTAPPTLTITVPELGNDNTPTISGTSDAPEGSEVIITITDKDGNTQTVTTKVDGEGNYKVDVPEALPEGEFTVTGVVTDPAGNPSEPVSDTGTIDTVPPTLTITVPELGNDNTPTISGTSDAPEGSEVVITITDKDGNTQTVTTKVDGEGNYKVDVPEALPEGDFTVTGVVTDPAGNPSEPASDTGTVDTVPPSLTITVPELGNDNTPTISGTSDAPEGSEVVITITDKDGNTQTVTTKVDGEGNYKVDVPEALPDGEFTVTGVVTDPAGNPSEPASDTGTIDTVPPSLTITVPELGNDNTPTISGTSDAPEGSEVVITITDKDGNTQTVTTKVDGEGHYKVDVPEALPEGEFTVTGVVTDPAGNPSEPASDQGTIDTVPPSLTITVPELGNDNTPTISGTSDAPEGSEVVITITDKDGNTQTVTTKVDGEGNYKVDVPEALPEGDFTVTGVVTDPAGNSTTSTDKGTVDTVPPVIDITGPIAGDDVISQVESGNPLEISGTTTAENGQIVTVTLDGNTYTATVTDGAWSLTVPEEDVQGLSQGDLKISADVSDKAGNPANDTHDIFVDTLPPVIDSVDAETDEDETVVFTWENFGITDANTDVTKLIVSITTLPTDGVLYLNGEAVTLGTTMSYDDIQAGRLTYVPNHNVSSDVAGRPLTNIGFSVSDGVNESTGSVDIVINAVADAPTIDFSEVTLVEPSLGLLETSIYYGAFTGLGSGGSGITYKDFNASFGSQKDATYQGKFSTDSINSANASNRDNILKQYETTLESNAKVKAYLDQGYTIKSFTRIQNGSGYDLVAGNNTGFYVVVTNGTKDVNVTVSLPTYTTVAETKGIIYLEAGQTYTFSGTFDDSAGIFIGAGTSVTDSTTGKTVTGGDGAWFKGYGTTSKFVFTVEEDGYYDFRFVTHNQSGPGGYVLTLNGKELNSDNFTLFPTPESLIEAAQADSNSDKIRIEYFTDPTTGTGHYKLYNANEGVTGKYVPLNAINVQLTDTDGSESISSVTLSGIPAGVTITDGNHIIISDGVTPIDVSKWNLDDLRVNSDVAQEFDITVTATSTEQSNQDSASSTGKIHVSIEEGANGEVIYPTDTTAPTLDAISVYDDGRVTFEFSEQVKYFDEGDIKVTGGTLKAGSLVDNGDGTWSAEIIPDADATEITVDVENNSYTDLAGNFGTGNTGSVTVTPPATSHAPSIDFEINSYTEVSTNGDLNGGREWNGSSYNGSWTINNPGSINDMKGAIGFDADNGNAIVSQTINTALPENAKLLIDLGWNNGWVPDGGSVATATFSFAGVDVLKVETTEGKAGALTYDANGKAVLADDVMYATVTVMNGASVTVNGVTYQSGESFQLKSWAQILNDTDHRNDAEYMASRWTSITVDLPSSLQGQTGTLAVSLVGGQDDIQIGALKVVTESGESSISSSTNVPTKVFSTISISDTDNDIASVQLKLTNSTDSTLTVQKDLLTDIFDVNFENGILTITEKSGVEATNDDWNSILASTTYFSSNSNANTITVTVTDSENQTASKSVDINGGVSTLTAKSTFALADSTTDDVIFNLLSDDNTGGNTETTDDHFVVGSTQTIDVSALLSDDATQTNIAEYVSVNYDANAQTATISIDRDGAGQAYQNADLLILTNQSSNVTLEQLLQNNQIIV